MSGEKETIYERKKVYKEVEVRAKDAVLKVSNHDYHNGKGYIKVAARSKKCNCAVAGTIALSVVDIGEIKKLQCLFNSESSTKNFKADIYYISIHKKNDNTFNTDIGKSIISTSGRSICSIPIILNKSDMDRIFKLISHALYDED